MAGTSPAMTLETDASYVGNGLVAVEAVGSTDAMAHRWRAAPIHETFPATGEEAVATDTNHLLDRVGFGEALLDARCSPDRHCDRA